ncbi:MAG: hypothetical protein J6A63_08690 [Clostridia bacterium]|nr:hypothetical protein [Clostridia bacterium]
MKENISAYIRSTLIGQSAKIWIKENRVLIKVGKDQEINFTATVGNYAFSYNQDLLGGEYKTENGKIVCINQKPTDFQSGETYLIEDIDFYTDMLGETEIHFEKEFSMLSVYLKTQDGKYCDFTLESDTIIVG